jgi:3-oxoacyl-[acyl-carrier-protein] synthase II
MRRVVVTGIGPVTALGIGKEALWDSLISQNMVLRSVPKEYEKNYHYKSRFYVPKPEVVLEEENSMMCESAKFALAAAKLALSDAGLTNYKDAGVILGIGIGTLKTGFTSYKAHTTGEGRFNRMVIPLVMPNSASAWVAIACGIQGVNYTVNAACASGSIAIGEAFLNIKNGRLDVALAGGTECFDDGEGAVMRGFDMLTTLTTSPDGKPMPFSKDRSGFLFNMGAGCILVLEELSHAIKRGAPIYAEILDYDANCDASSIIQMDSKGEKIEELFTKVKHLPIDYINAHATGTIQNDEIEAKVIQKLFSKMPYVGSTKSILGHSIGASGALEAAVTILSIKNKKIHGTLSSNIMEDLNVPTSAMDLDIEYAVSTSYGFGGHNALLLFKNYE